MVWGRGQPGQKVAFKYEVKYVSKWMKLETQMKELLHT